MALSFLPRGVAAKRVAARDESIASSDQPEQMQLDGPHSPSSPSDGAHSPKQIPLDTQRNKKTPNRSVGGSYQYKPTKPIKPRELCVLVETAMSDYALWANADLRRYAADRNTSGYLSLSRLLTESSLLQATGQTIAEASVFQALKDYGSGTLELQLKLTTAARNRQKAGGDSLYKIRRVDWEGIREKPDLQANASDDHTPSVWDRSEDVWNERTVYVENIPRTHWTLPTALLFIHSCVQPTSTTADAGRIHSEMEMDANASVESLKIQHLELPAHAKASQNDIPVCKGFAFVTFSEVQYAESFLAAWPWAGTHKPGVSKGGNEEEEEDDVGEQLMNLDLTKEKDEHKEAVTEGRESGLRSISLNGWEELRKESLAWQAELYDNMKPSESKGYMQPTSSVKTVAKPIVQTTREAPPHLAPVQKRTDQRKSGPAQAAYDEPSFPAGCLLFVKNLHPQTNKTTLKKLFEHALESSAGKGGVDYVDWSKGMSSCHLRLSDPAAARALVGFFSIHPLVQTDGDDAQGQPWVQAATLPSVIESGLKPVVTELVEGRAEEIYWEKVPQKIRAVAISKSKAISIASATKSGLQDGSEVEVDRKAIKRASEEPKEGERENKRRRKA